MTPPRLVFALVAGLLFPASLFADATTPPSPAAPAAPAPATLAAPPFTMEKHYSAETTVTLKGGMIIGSKSYIDGDKMRSDVQMHGMDMSIIVRKDTKKIYQVLTDQKMVMESDFDPTKSIGQKAEAAYGPEGKFELIGPETVDGIACTKYKVTSDKNQQVFFFWLDTAKKVPVEMAAADSSMTVKWSNYSPGPQDPALFEVPTGFQVMQMPAGMGMPGGGMPGGGGPGGMPGAPGGGQ